MFAATYSLSFYSRHGLLLMYGNYVTGDAFGRVSRVKHAKKLRAQDSAINKRYRENRQEFKSKQLNAGWRSFFFRKATRTKLLKCPPTTISENLTSSRMALWQKQNNRRSRII